MIAMILFMIFVFIINAWRMDIIVTSHKRIQKRGTSEDVPPVQEIYLNIMLSLFN
jgi:hypothetical protein